MQLLLWNRRQKNEKIRDKKISHLLDVAVIKIILKTF